MPSLAVTQYQVYISAPARQASVNKRQFHHLRSGLIEHFKRTCIQSGWENVLQTSKYQMLQNLVDSMEMKRNMSRDGKQLMKVLELTKSHKHAIAERQHTNRANRQNQDLLVCHFVYVRNLVFVMSYNKVSFWLTLYWLLIAAHCNFAGLFWYDIAWYWIENWFYFLVKLDWIPIKFTRINFAFMRQMLAHMMPSSHFDAF